MTNRVNGQPPHPFIDGVAQNLWDAQPPGPINTEHYYKYGNLPIHGHMLVAGNAPPHADYQLVATPKVGTFRLWIPEEHDKLHEILGTIGRGAADLRYEEHQYVADHTNWIILLGWADLHWEPPRNAPITAASEEPSQNGDKTVVYR